MAVVYRASKRLPNGKVIYAKNYGKKAFPMRFNRKKKPTPKS